MECASSLAENYEVKFPYGEGVPIDVGSSTHSFAARRDTAHMVAVSSVRSNSKQTQTETANDHENVF